MIKILGNRVLIREIEVEQTEKVTKGGLIIEEVNASPIVVEGEIIQLGNKVDRGSEMLTKGISRVLREPAFKEKDKILFKKYGLDQITVDEEILYLIDSKEIMAVCSDD